MRLFISIMGSGILFTGGIVLLALAVVLRAKWRAQSIRGGAVAIATIAGFAIAFSATPLPSWLYLIWSAAGVAWLLASFVENRTRGANRFIEGLFLGITVAALAAELPFDTRPTISARGRPRLYVIGDSITAGIGREGGKTWPAILHDSHHIQVINLSHPGVGAGEELRRIADVPLESGLVLLEIGGNDALGHRDPRQFGRALDALVGHCAGPGRLVVMLELPLFPFDTDYGRQQRSVARRHHVTLIPRRYFAEVLSAPGATVDGIHLSESGQHRMAQVVWELIGSSLSPTQDR